MVVSKFIFVSVFVFGAGLERPSQAVGRQQQATWGLDPEIKAPLANDTIIASLIQITCNSFVSNSVLGKRSRVAHFFPLSSLTGISVQKRGANSFGNCFQAPKSKIKKANYLWGESFILPSPIVFLFGCQPSPHPLVPLNSCPCSCIIYRMWYGQFTESKKVRGYWIIRHKHLILYNVEQDSCHKLLLIKLTYPFIFPLFSCLN